MMGYNIDRHLKCGSIRVKVCLSDLICGPSGKIKGEKRGSGGPLAACGDDFKDCRLVGVYSGSISAEEFFVSTHTKQAFIKRSLNNIGFVRAGVVRAGAMSKLLDYHFLSLR